MLEAKISLPLTALVYEVILDADAKIPSGLGIMENLNFAAASVTNMNLSIAVSTIKRFAVEGVAEVGIPDLLYVQGEPRHVQKGAEVASSIFGAVVSEVSKFDCFEIPVSLGTTFSARPVEPFVFAGPSIAFARSAEGELMGTVNDLGSEVKSPEYGLPFGCEIGRDIFPKDKGIADVRYSIGLSRSTSQTRLVTEGPGSQGPSNFRAASSICHQPCSQCPRNESLPNANQEDDRGRKYGR